MNSLGSLPDFLTTVIGLSNFKEMLDPNKSPLAYIAIIAPDSLRVWIDSILAINS